MVAEPQIEPFITRELYELVIGLEGEIHKPSSLPQDLKDMKHWLKVEQNERGQWKKPFYYRDGERKDLNWNLRSMEAQFDLYTVLDQEPLNKAGFHARDSICVIDLDGVIDPVTLELIEPTIRDLISDMRFTVYLSSSGEGLHIPFKLPEELLFPEVPSKNLNYRETEGKSGQFLGGAYASFVAFTGVAVPPYDLPTLPEINRSEWEYIREFLWSAETVTHTEPSEPIPLATQASTPQARAPRESEAKESPFGIKWKPNYRSHVESVFNGFDDPKEGSDTSISGRCNQWVSLYIRGAEHWTYDRAIHLSKQVEGKCLAKNPTRNKKSHKWHEEKVISRIRLFSELGLLVYRKKHDREGKMPFDILKLEALDYALATKMKPRTEKVFLTIVVLSKGRSGFKLRDARVAEASGLDRGTVIKAKKEIRKGDFLKIEGARNNTYTII